MAIKPTPKTYAISVRDFSDYAAILHGDLIPYMDLLSELNVADAQACREQLALRRQGIPRAEPGSIQIEELQQVSSQGKLKLRLYYP